MFLFVVVALLHQKNGGAVDALLLMVHLTDDALFRYFW